MKKYYKVLKDNKVIDVLDQLVFLKYQNKHGIMVQCDINEAQAILSSDARYIWHEETLYKIPVDGYDTVKIEEIDIYEYDKLRMLNLKSVESITEEFLLSLIEGGIL